MQLVRLRHGYTFEEFRADMRAMDLDALRRVDRQAVFYGGMPSAGTPAGTSVRDWSPARY